MKIVGVLFVLAFILADQKDFLPTASDLIGVYTFIANSQKKEK